MVGWDDHYFCPTCRDDLKGDDPCDSSTDCSVCSAFSEEQRKKIKKRNGYKSKKDQNSSAFCEGTSRVLSGSDKFLSNKTKKLQQIFFQI